MSEPGYVSNCHVAGDPTLFIIRSGICRIGLRDESYRDFATGNVFIAQDKITQKIFFVSCVYGHTAQLIGDQLLIALHLKHMSI